MSIIAQLTFPKFIPFGDYLNGYKPGQGGHEKVYARGHIPPSDLWKIRPQDPKTNGNTQAIGSDGFEIYTLYIDTIDLRHY
jgi:hypothetical protein